MGFEAGALALEEMFAGEAMAAGAMEVGAGEAFAAGAMEVGAGEALATGAAEVGAGEIAAGAAGEAVASSAAESTIADTAFNEYAQFDLGQQGFMPGESGGMPTGTQGTWDKFINQAIGSGVNWYQGQQLKNLAGTADPFAAYRPQFAQQLSALMANPALVTQMPGYTAGMTAAEQALTRNLASQGLTGSGTAASALTNFGAQYQSTAFNNLLTQLAGLSGANISGAGTNLQGTMAGMNLQNQALFNLYKAFPSGGIWGGGGTEAQTPGIAWEPITPPVGG